jgi:hypothetical protein
LNFGELGGNHTYAFQVTDTEFDSTFERIKQAGLRPLEP